MNITTLTHHCRVDATYIGHVYSRYQHNHHRRVDATYIGHVYSRYQHNHHRRASVIRMGLDCPHQVHSRAISERFMAI